MSDGRAPWATVVTVAAVVWAGCGGDDGGAKPDGLAKPLYPRCGVAGYAKATGTVTRGPAGRGRAWRLSYVPPATPRGAPVPETAATSILVIEEVPDLPLELAESRAVNLGGREVRLARPPRTIDVVAVQVKTRSARYTVLARGSPRLPARRMMERLVPCLP